MERNRTRRTFRARRVFAAVAGSATLAVVLSSCAVLEGPKPATPERPKLEVPPASVEFVLDGTAEQNLPFFTRLLTEYGAGQEPIEGQPIVDAVAAGGFDRAAMQVSFDRSKTNLVADSIYVSVQIGEDCLIGQLITENREVVAKNVPAVGPEKNTCLIGKTRAIDW